jgi:hypothetical protein
LAAKPERTEEHKEEQPPVSQRRYTLSPAIS